MMKKKLVDVTSDVNYAPDGVAEAARAFPVAQLLQIDPGLLVPTPDNARAKIDKKSAKYQELLASVRVEGVRVPVAARPFLPEQSADVADGRRYDLRYGERRREAAIDAGLATIPVLVYEGLSDELAYEMTFIENSHRDDLKPVELGRSVMTDLAKHGNDVRAVAARYGRSVEWVRTIAKLRDLSPAVAAKVETDAKFALWTTAHLVVLAQLPAAVQEQFVRERCKYRADQTVKRLEQQINADYRRLLSKAPFDVENPVLAPKVGPCSECKRRESRVSKLWEDDDTGVTPATDRCLDPACWQAKMAAHMRGLATALKAKGHEAVFGRTEFVGNYETEQRLKVQFGEVVAIDKYDYTPAKEGVKGAMPVVVVQGPGVGEVKWFVKQKSRGEGLGGGAKRNTSAEREQTNRWHGEERKKIAQEFASAACALALADKQKKGPTDEEIERTIVRCIVYRLAEPGLHHSAAFEWLLERVGLTKLVKQSWGAEVQDLLPAGQFPLNEEYRAAAALAVFLCEQEAGEEVFGLDHEGKVMKMKIAKLPMPQRRPEIRKAAAEAFVITEGFLAKHCAANVQGIARELGVKVVNKKGDQVKAIVDAKLAAGTMTKELAAAFGVAGPKEGKPELATKDTKKKAGKKTGKKGKGLSADDADSAGEKGKKKANGKASEEAKDMKDNPFGFRRRQGIRTLI